MSDHFDGRKYFNPVEPAQKSYWQLLRWLATRRRQRWPRWIDDELFPAPAAHLDADALALTFVNHLEGKSCPLPAVTLAGQGNDLKPKGGNMSAILLGHPVAPLCVLCAAAWFLVFVCGFLCPPGDPQRSAPNPKGR